MFRTRFARALAITSILAACLMSPGASRATAAPAAPSTATPDLAALCFHAPPSTPPPPIAATVSDAEALRRIQVLAADPQRRVSLLKIAGSREYDESDRIEAFVLVLAVDRESGPPDPVH